MKILVVCQYYYPEPFRIPDICEQLSAKGHDVTVVTGIPNYPMGVIYEGYRRGRNRDEVINGVKVHRCFTTDRRSGPIWRFLNYYSYALSSSRYISKLKDDFDVVFVNQLSPVMMAKAGITYKKKFSKKLVLYCLDLWPESLIAGGIKKTSPIYKYFHKVSESIYRQADEILITSKSFSDYFDKEFGIKNVKYAPQYAEAIFSPDVCEKKADDTVDLMFAGNVGAAQSVDTIIKAAAVLKAENRLRWHIVGDGSEIDFCKRLTDELGVTSVTFHGRKTLDEMPRYYSMADAMIVTMMSDPFTSLTLPGKVQTYMAAGKPIIGAADGETEYVINTSNCGFCAGAEDVDGLADCVKRFLQMEDKEKLSENAIEYYNKHFTRENFIDKLEKLLRN